MLMMNITFTIIIIKKLIIGSEQDGQCNVLHRPSRMPTSISNPILESHSTKVPEISTF